MESVESPLEVLSRAATMVQHCRTYSNSEQPDDADSLNGGSPCGSNASASPPSSEAASATLGTENATVKQLPSSKWRRERRCTTRIPDYKHRESNLGNKALRSQSFNDKSTSKAHLEQIGRPRSGDNSLHHSDGDLAHYDDKNNRSDSESSLSPKTVPFSSLKAVCMSKPPEYIESPLDMSVKIRNSPPSYSQSISSTLYRPSVITQASANGSPPNPVSPTSTKIDAGKGEYIPGSMSMCDPVIDEHFRRSLGADYMSLFGKSKDEKTNGVSNGKGNKVFAKDRGSSPIMFASDPCTKYLPPVLKPAKEAVELDIKEPEKEDCKMDIDECPGLTVDDHFAKALGDTWKKLQEKNHKGDGKISDVQKSQSFSSAVADDRKDLANTNHDKKHSRSIVI